MDIRFKTPFSLVCSGASQCGKTMHVWKLIKSRDLLFTVEPDYVIYFYSEWQPIFSGMYYDHYVSDSTPYGPLIDEWCNQIPTTEILKEKLSQFSNRKGSLIVIDDFADNVTDDVVKIFTVRTSCIIQINVIHNSYYLLARR